jgi:hypothetical protein
MSSAKGRRGICLYLFLCSLAAEQSQSYSRLAACPQLLPQLVEHAALVLLPPRRHHLYPLGPHLLHCLPLAAAGMIAVLAAARGDSDQAGTVSTSTAAARGIAGVASWVHR